MHETRAHAHAAQTRRMRDLWPPVPVTHREASAHLLAGRVAFVFLLRASALDMQAHNEAELLGYLTGREQDTRPSNTT